MRTARECNAKKAEKMHAELEVALRLLERMRKDANIANSLHTHHLLGRPRDWRRMTLRL